VQFIPTQCFDVQTSLQRVQTFLLQSLHIPGLRDCAMAALLGVCHSSGALEFELDLVSVLLDLEDAAAAAADTTANDSTTTAGATAGAQSAAVSNSSKAAAELIAVDALLQFAESSYSHSDRSAVSNDTTAGDAATATTDAAADSDRTAAAAAAPAPAVPLLQGAAAAGLHAFVREVAAETARRRRTMHVVADSSDSDGSAATAGAVTDASFDAAMSSAYVQLSEGGLVAASSDSGNRSVPTTTIHFAAAIASLGHVVEHMNCHW
jgi:hypothetical protein